MSITRPTLLVVTGVGVGLLTLAYVLGVQVGKQSAALRKISPSGAGEELQSLPIPLAEQLRQIEAVGGSKPASPAPEPPKAEPKPEPPPPEAPKTEKTDKLEKSKEKGKWTVQLVATSDPGEAKRIAARATAAGFPTVLIEEKGVSKVRISKPTTKEAADALAERLKGRGFKAFPMKAD